MIKSYLSIIVVLMTIGLVNPSEATTYPQLEFQIATSIPAIHSITSKLTLSKGDADINLSIRYNSNNAGFSCSDDSKVNNLPVICNGTQQQNIFSVTIANPSLHEKITLKGETDSTELKVSYKGPLGKSLTNKVAADIQSSPAPIYSTVTLTPTIDDKGKVSGTGLITSAYGVSHNAIALSGKMNLKKKTVSWFFKYQSDNLIFSGKEGTGTWNGRLTGKIGPSKVLQTISIPLLSSTSRFHGIVSSSSDASMPQGLEGVSVVIRTDLDNDGTINANEIQTVTSDSSGKFDISTVTSSDRPVTVDFNLEGYSQTPKLFAGISLGTDVPISTSLRKLDSLTVSSNSASTADKKLQLDNLPSTISDLNGKVFNPVTESSQFPGEFADNTGNMLISSVFTNIQAQDSQGNKISELDKDTELRMQVPNETWNTMRDLTPNNNQIDVPLYYYDESSGQWKRSNSDGWLENNTRVKLAESDLTAVKQGSYVGPLFAVGNITHLSYWNIDWPIDTHQCVCGRIVDADGNPVIGAIVSAKGVTYSGASAPVTTGADGRFCIDVMRSEANNEDLDDDGVKGEEQKIVLDVSYDGRYYKLPEETLPSIPANSGSSDCKQLGNIELNKAQELTLSMCNIKGQALYNGIWSEKDPLILPGTPLNGAMIIGFDSSNEEWWTVCLKQTCNLITTTDNNGNFSLQIPVLMGVQLFGIKYSQPTPTSFEGFQGMQELNACPTEPVILKLDAYGWPGS